MLVGMYFTLKLQILPTVAFFFSRIRLHGFPGLFTDTSDDIRVNFKKICSFFPHFLMHCVDSLCGC